MSNTGWREVVLGDVCHITDGAHSKVDRQDEGRLYLTSKNIKKGNLDLSKVDYINEADFERLFPEKSKSGRRPKKGDLLIGIIGTFGNAYMYKSTDNFGMSSSVGLIRPDSTELDSLFLYYVIISRRFFKIIESYKSGSVQGYTNIPTLKTIPFNLPPLPTQKAIAKILGDLDAKIELNRKMNESLEAMAQAVFQSWFVDFDAVLDNFLTKNGANVAALPESLRKKGSLRLAVTKKNTPEINELFPDSFVFNEVLEKWIPEGWGDVKLNEIAEVKYGKDHKKLPAGKFPCYGSGGVMRYVDSTLYEDHSVLIPRKGTLSNLMYIRNPFWSVDTMFYTTFKEASHVKFLYYNLRRLNLSEMNVGSAVPSMTTVVLNDLKFVFPSKKNIKRFDIELEDLYLKIESNKSQTQALTKLRDTLLPQLISGKLSVPNAMLEVEKNTK